MHLEPKPWWWWINPWLYIKRDLAAQSERIRRYESAVLSVYNAVTFNRPANRGYPPGRPIVIHEMVKGKSSSCAKWYINQVIEKQIKENHDK